MSTDSESITSTNEFPYAEGYAFDWNEDLSLNEPSLRSPRPCKHGVKCYYKNKETGRPCGFVHPGEEGTGRKQFPGRTLTFKNKEGEDVSVEQGPCVRLIGGAEYYMRLKAKMSWQEWQQMKQRAAQQAVHQAVRRVTGEHRGHEEEHRERHPRAHQAAAGGGGGGRGGHGGSRGGHHMDREYGSHAPRAPRAPRPASLLEHVEEAMAAPAEPPKTPSKPLVPRQVSAPKKKPAPK